MLFRWHFATTVTKVLTFAIILTRVLSAGRTATEHFLLDHFQLFFWKHDILNVNQTNMSIPVYSGFFAVVNQSRIWRLQHLTFCEIGKAWHMFPDFIKTLSISLVGLFRSSLIRQCIFYSNRLYFCACLISFFCL